MKLTVFVKSQFVWMQSLLSSARVRKVNFHKYRI